MRENRKKVQFMTTETLVAGEKEWSLDTYEIILIFIWKNLYLTLGTKVNSRLSSDLNMKGTIISILEDKERKKKRMNKHRNHFKVKEWVPLSAWTMTLGTLRAPRRPCLEATLHPVLRPVPPVAGWLAGCPHHR